MQFLTGSALTKAIKTILNEPGVRCAVAFWGAGCETWLTGKKARVICNLKTGGTNPYALEKLNPKVNLKQNNKLHAKVYIGKTHSIVASANVSANGIGDEDGELRGWLEAGMLVQTTKEIKTWFEKQWGVAQEISDFDWTIAKSIWKLRQKSKNELAVSSSSTAVQISFSEFDINQETLPCIDWWNDYLDGEINEHSVKGALDVFDKSIDLAVLSGCEIGKGDDQNVPANKWVLRFKLSGRGIPDLRSPFKFVKIGDVFVRHAYEYREGGASPDVLLAEITQPPEIPFDPNEKKFKQAFALVLEKRKYRNFLKNSSNYYKSTKNLIGEFWNDVKSEYSANK